MHAIPTIFDDLDHEAGERAWAEGEADVDAGQVVSHQEVAAWLKSWVTDHELPPPKCPGE